ARATNSEKAPLAFEVLPPAVLSVETASASLGQWVNISGGGFLGCDRASTVLLFEGSVRQGHDHIRPFSTALVPEVSSGRRVRYVVSEDDALGKTIDVRLGGYRLEGTVAPLVSFDGTQSRGEAMPFALDIAPVKQVVYVRFLDSYRDGLASFGLRALDQDV